MNLDHLSTLYRDNHTALTAVAFLTGLGLLLVLINRLRRLGEHRLTMLVANFLTVIAAVLATMVSASGMWKFFTDILGESPLRIAFFAYIEVALFASALLARARLLREPEKGTTGADGAAVWILAALTASLSALDAASFREVCLRLVAPLVAAWMWERALAAERSARLGSTMSRIHWTITIERILIWLHLAEPHGRDVSDIDRARRRARLGRARLNLYLLHQKKAATWRIRLAHNRVIRQSMQAAEHIGLAHFPDAADEREATQMYMATLYGVVDATSPEAVARFNAWRLDDAITAGSTERAETGPATSTAVDASPQVPEDVDTETELLDDDATVRDPADRDHTAGTRGKAADVPTGRWTAEDPQRAEQHGESPWSPTGYTSTDDTSDLSESGNDDEADRSVVAAMRRFWDSEILQGRVPTGAELSRAAGVLPTTGLGRRKRREWESELSEPVKTTVTAGR